MVQKGIFPASGVLAEQGRNTYAPRNPPVAGCAPNFYPATRCAVKIDPDSLNGIMSAILCAIDAAGLGYDCNDPCQLAKAMRRTTHVCRSELKGVTVFPPPEWIADQIMDDVSDPPVRYLWSCSKRAYVKMCVCAESTALPGKLIFDFTGTYQPWTVPAGAKTVRFTAWGAGGGQNSEIYGLGNFPGGAGGFTTAEFAATGALAPGQPVSIVVGQGGETYPNPTGGGQVPGDGAPQYGFGGAESYSSAGGGGLSGVFVGAGPVGSGDWGRALVIAGGGGASAEHGDSPGQVARGGAGNDAALGGGQSDMMGAATTNNTQGGGGGGYRGGALHQRGSPATVTGIQGGNGGSGFVAATATAQSILTSGDGQSVPPQTGHTDYAAGIGVGGPGVGGVGSDRAGGHGRVVIEWTV